MDVHSAVNVHDDFISNLESTFSKSLHIEDAQNPEHASEGDDNCNLGAGDTCGGFEQQEIKLDMKCLKEHSTFPYQSPHQSNSCSVSLPVSCKC